METPSPQQDLVSNVPNISTLVTISKEDNLFKLVFQVENGINELNAYIVIDCLMENIPKFKEYVLNMKRFDNFQEIRKRYISLMYKNGNKLVVYVNSKFVQFLDEEYH